MNQQQSQISNNKDGMECFVVVTRPRRQLDELLIQLSESLVSKKLNAHVLGLPLLEIEPITDASLAKELVEKLQQSDLVIFVSPNAVYCAKDLLDAYGFTWPVDCRVAVVGGGTEQALKTSGISMRELIKPTQGTSWDSEGLWAALGQLKQSWQDSKVVFVKGVGGRNWLMDRFAQSGAKNEFIEVYKRSPLLTTDPAWQAVGQMYELQNRRASNSIQNQKQHKSIWLLTSSEAVLQIPDSLQKLGIPLDYLKNSHAICTHERIKQTALDIGFGDVKLCEAGDLNLVNATNELLLDSYQ